ncbi:response regulator [Deferribacter autotrophicus]|uniref:Response regulator n=1 Tax=Deferribacter autotrophicus TaxID=500465 RepID=A0A5A8F8D5_9BACT|nr:HD domain-containing phosphohydrolase [Deferribacter autotrophicus]KAA0258413.1 response regulator [Deferribacter autotrophicus]
MEEFKYKILVVDDEDYVRDSLDIILSTEGYQVVGVSSGYEALELLEKNYFDFVITDIKMPEMDGITLLRKIREGYPDLPVIVMTGFPSIDSAIECLKEGAFDYVTKPFKVEDLINKLQKADENRKLKKEVVELKQLLKIYDAGLFFNKTLDHEEILNGMEKMLFSDSLVYGCFFHIFTKAFKKSYNLSEDIKHYLDTRFSFKNAAQLFYGKNLINESVKINGKDVNLLVIPMYFEKFVWGIFALVNVGSKVFDVIHERIYSIFVNQFSIALRNSYTYEELAKGYFETINSLAVAVDAKDHYTRGHSENVKNYSLMIVEEFGFSENFKEVMTYAGLLHDIGKIGVPTHVITKPDKLTDEEFEEMKKHPIYGKEILEPIEFLGDVPDYILYHHEKLDGSGYPFGLTANEIPLGAKILQVADSFDAMTTDRSYRKRRTLTWAMEELDRCSGTQFDTEIVKAFKSAMKRRGFTW